MDNKTDNITEIEQKKIISGLQNKIALNAIIFIIFLSFAYLSVLPARDEYVGHRDNLLQQMTQYKDISKKGISFADFSSLITDEELKKMIGKIGEDFYNKNLKNTKSLSYLDYIKEKTEYINKIKTSDKIKLRDQKLTTVLPSYQEGVTVEGAMSDLDFVNYIENLLKAFGLQTPSTIGINDVVLVDEKETPKKIDSLSSQIFYIPLNLDIKGRKSDIVDFLYYLQNVGEVQKVENDDIRFYKDNVLFKAVPGYGNIYETKLVDISNIKVPQYIDTSSFSRNTGEKSTLGLISFIRNGVESNDLYQVSVGLRFYVKGLPIYKLEDYISKIVKNYKEVKSTVEKNLTQAKNRKTVLLNTEILSAIATFKSIKLYLDDLDPTIKKLEGGLKQKTGLEKLYIDATKVRYDLGNMSELLNKNIQDIEKSAKNKK